MDLRNVGILSQHYNPEDFCFSRLKVLEKNVLRGMFDSDEKVTEG